MSALSIVTKSSEEKYNGNNLFHFKTLFLKQQIETISSEVERHELSHFWFLIVERLYFLKHIDKSENISNILLPVLNYSKQKIINVYDNVSRY